MNEGLQIGLLAMGIPVVMIAFSTTILHYFVALKSRPSQRAAWTVGVAYTIVVALLSWGAPAGYELWAVLASAPAALIAFWFWRHEFKRAWVDDPELLPDGVTLIEDDWQSGLLRLALVIVVGVGIALFRMITKGIAGSL
jgi:hypothetical protein